MELNDLIQFKAEQNSTPDAAQNSEAAISYSIPPAIADLTLPPPSGELAEILQEVASVIPANGTLSGTAVTMESLLLRAEAINSSRIEGYLTSPRNLALAEAGAQPDLSAPETARNTRALRDILLSPNQEVSLNSLLTDHATIMETETFAGRLRLPDEEVYIGADGIDNAMYVAPLPARVEQLIQDWVRFTNRTDLPVIPQLAISHAQFECIHPFIDGNGRVGRAAILRQLLQAGCAPLPVSAAFFRSQECYYDLFLAYQEGSLDYPIRTVATAIWVAAKSLQDNMPAQQFILDNWYAKTNAHTKQRANTKQALHWIFKNPAFTTSNLAAGINVSHRTADRIVNQLAELEIVTTAKKTYKPAAGYPQKIWEAHEVYDLIEQIERSVYRYTYKVTQERFKQPDISKPFPLEARNTKKTLISEIIKQAEQHPHPLLTFPTADTYSYGFSLFEFFVIANEQIEARYLIDNCKIYAYEEDGTSKIGLSVKYGDAGASFNTSYGASLAADDNDTLFQEFSILVNNGLLKDDLRRNLRWHWELLLKEFEDLMQLYHMWQAIGSWGKFPGPRYVDYSVDDHIKAVGAAIGEALFTRVDSFLQPENEQAVNNRRKLGLGTWGSFSPSLPAFIGKMQRLQSEPQETLRKLLDEQEFFSVEQREQIMQLEKTLAEYKRKNKIWQALARENGFLKMSSSEKIDVLKDKINSSGDSKELFATYFNTMRNFVAHDTSMDKLIKFFMVHYGYNEGSIEIKTIEAIELIFDFLKQIHIKVFSLAEQSLLERRKYAEHTAMNNAQEVYRSLHESAGARELHQKLELNRNFRLHHSTPHSQHECSLPLGFDNRLLMNQPVRDFCEQCGGIMHALALDEATTLQLVTCVSKEPVSCEPKEFKMFEGAYGHTMIHALVPNETFGDQWRDIGPDTKICIAIRLHDEELWSGEGKVKFIFGNSDGINLHCKAEDLFSLPDRRYHAIMSRQPDHA